MEHQAEQGGRSRKGGTRKEPRASGAKNDDGAADMEVDQLIANLEETGWKVVPSRWKQKNDAKGFTRQGR